MADYFSLLSRAVANLPKSSPASARQAIYDRARKALINQLRSLKPQLPESDISREERALDDAVQRLEAEYEPTMAGARPATQAVTLPLPPVPPRAPPPAPKPAESSSPLADPFAASAVAQQRADARSVAPPPSAPRVSPYVAPALSASTARKAAEEAPAPIVSAEPIVIAGPDNAPRLNSNREPLASPNAPRFESEPPRPVAPTPARAGRATPWAWIALAVVLGLVGSVAVAAFFSREKPQDLTIKEHADTTAAAAPVSGGQKIVERVGAPTPTPSDTPTPTPAPTPAAPAASAAPASPPSPTPTAANVPAPPPAAAPIPVAARAAMLVATVSDAQKPAVSLGTVVWSVAPANPGQPGSVGVKADIDVPDLKMHASMVLRKNVDAGLPASHTIDLRITFDPGSPFKGVKDIALPQMRRDDPPAADPLSGVRVKINDSYFLIGLNRADADVAHNLDEIATRGWFDFPMQLSDDRIAKLTFEKATDGEKIVADALAAWKQ